MGNYWLETGSAAAQLRVRLRTEAVAACAGHKRIFLLLSGGLDSRVVAGVLAELYREGRLSVRPIGVTWGLEDSRDVVYGREVARILDFEWLHLPLNSGHLWGNIRTEAPRLGALVSPLHLHRMDWLGGLDEGDLVLAGSYGDSIGRGEFCGVHLLALPPYRSINRFGLLQSTVVAAGSAEIARDLEALHGRGPEAPARAHREWEQMAFYMRNQLADSMAGSAPAGRLYQMFTAPEVYSFVWSLHPAARGDASYFELLETLDPRLAKLPWARTNRAVRGRTDGARRDLRPSFHQYSRWTSVDLQPQLAEIVDPELLAATGVFDADAVRRLVTAVSRDPDATGRDSYQIHERLAWLASIVCFLSRLRESGRDVSLPEVVRDEFSSPGGSGGALFRGGFRESASRDPERRLDAPGAKTVIGPAARSAEGEGSARGSAANHGGMNRNRATVGSIASSSDLAVDLPENGDDAIPGIVVHDATAGRATHRVSDRGASQLGQGGRDRGRIAGRYGAPRGSVHDELPAAAQIRRQRG